ncbi:MAG: dihydroneopterin aldolase [Spirochaetota bacterium]
MDTPQQQTVFSIPTQLAVLRFKNLRLRTVIGIHDWEKKIKQDVIISLKVLFSPGTSHQTDEYEGILDYDYLMNSVVQEVEENRYQLIEALAQKVLDIVLDCPQVVEASVEVDKPDALRYMDSVSIELVGKKKG